MTLSTMPLVLAMITILVPSISLAGECPQDPLQCLVVQMLNAKNAQDQQERAKSNSGETDQPADPSAVPSEPSSASAIAVLEDILKESGSPSAAATTSRPHHHHHRTAENVTYCVGQNVTSPGCQKCSPCPKNALLLRSCNSSHDSVCVCQDGTYFHALAFECRPCDQCQPGYGLWRQCTRNRNTQCRECPPGTYSGPLGCVLCSACRHDQVMLQECSRTQDTVCIDKTITHKRYFAIEGARAHDVQSHYVQSSALPVYFTMLVMLVFGLIVYVIMQCRWKRSNQVKPPTTNPIRSHVVYMPTSIPLRHVKRSPTATTTSGGNQYIQLAAAKTVVVSQSPASTSTKSGPGSTSTAQTELESLQSAKNVVISLAKGQYQARLQDRTAPTNRSLVRSGSKSQRSSGARSSSRTKRSNSAGVRRSESVRVPMLKASPTESTNADITGQGSSTLPPRPAEV